MAEVLLQLIPLIAVTVSPSMIALVILLLISQDGLVKSLAFLAGKVLCYALWGLLFWSLAEKISLSRSGVELSANTVLIQIVIGGLLVIVAVKSYFVEDDPDAAPPKWMSVIDELGPIKLFAIGFLISIFQPRFVMLMLIGTAYISDAQLRWEQVVNLMSVLILGMVWSQLVPLAVYLLKRQQADVILTSMNDWLTHHQRLVNVAVLGIFGIVILLDGLVTLLA